MSTMYASFVIKYNYERKQWMIEIRIFCRQFDTNNYNYEKTNNYNERNDRNLKNNRLNTRLLSSIIITRGGSWMIEICVFCH